MKRKSSLTCISFAFWRYRNKVICYFLNSKNHYSFSVPVIFPKKGIFMKRLSWRVTIFSAWNWQINIGTSVKKNQHIFEIIPLMWNKEFVAVEVLFFSLSKSPIRSCALSGWGPSLLHKPTSVSPFRVWRTSLASKHNCICTHCHVLCASIHNHKCLCVLAQIQVVT
jgi:hypothetical protein